MRGRIPVAAFIGAAADELTMSFVEGSHGQTLIDADYGGLVLRLSGELLAELQRIPVDTLEGIIPGTGEVLVHGDFGPQNLLIDEEVPRVTALLDWEFAHMGEPVEDLAWAEWIVRMHHPTRKDDLDSLFEGYGERPAWSIRHAEVVRRCEQLVHFAEFQGWTDGTELWRQRVRATQNWAE
jgi:Ser/Thr protein kinase RdoA (MazF antagonist)